MSVCTGWWETGVAAGGVTLEPHPCGLQGHPIMGGRRLCRPRSEAKGQIRSEQEEARVHQGAECPLGQQGQRRGRVQGQHMPPPPGNSRYGAWPKVKALSMAHHTAKVLGHSGDT